MSSVALEAIHRIRQQHRIESKTGERLLWNAAPVEALFTHNGDSYAVPPNGPGKMTGDKAVKNYDGTLKVYDVYGIDPRQAKRAREEVKRARKEGQPEAEVMATFQRRVVVSSIDIVSHAVKKLAVRGVVALTGDAEIDAQLRDAAQIAWTEFRRNEAEKALERYDAKKAVFYSQPRNADQPPPPMTPREQEAFVWLADYRLGLTSNTNNYVCPESQCPFQHADEDVMTQHILAFHPTRAAQIGTEAEKVEKKNKGGRPKKVVAD